MKPFLVLALLGVSLPQAPMPLASQLKAGETTYFLTCAMCHGDHLQGVSAPALSGEAFSLHFEGLHMNGLTEFIQTEMPLDRPGSLTEQEVLDVAAYLLNQNGVKLPETGLSSVHLDQPLRFKP